MRVNMADTPSYTRASFEDEGEHASFCFVLRALRFDDDHCRILADLRMKNLNYIQWLDIAEVEFLTEL